ncbi:MAG: glycosyltransferase family 2 protein [Thermomonas sp.]|uniref:glycosyltransferase family 2 protein n=1 Tax=Thermomonas sp. TaxID=1971895 RepID=UPI0039E5AF96
MPRMLRVARRREGGVRISIAMCTYNGARFLGEQLDSLLAQARLPDEVVVGDDGSTDATLEMLQAFAVHAGERGVRVDIVRNAENLGFAANFDATLRRATGDIVFLCDQDDVWHPDKIARMCAQFDARPRLGLLHADARLIDAEGRDMGCSLFEALEMTPAERDAEHAGRALDALLRRNLVTGATMAIRREALASALPVPEGCVHDDWLALRCALDWQVDCMEWASIRYRQHDGNQIGMRKRTLRDKLSGLDRPKRMFMAEMAHRLDVFLQRCDDDGLMLSPERRSEIEARITHVRMRAALPATPIARLRAVLAEMRTGRYRAYSSGLRSIVSDLLDMN